MENKKEIRAKIDVTGFVVLAATLVIGVVVVALLFNAMPTVNDTQANNAITSIKNNTWTAFGLLAIVLIVGAAWGIIAIIRK